MMTEEEKMIDFNEMMLGFEEYNDLVNKFNKRIYKAIKNQLGKKYLSGVKECLQDCEAEGKLELVNRPNLEPQHEEEWVEFDHVFVDQYENGGMEGDSFAGYIYIPLKENLYLKSHYSM